MICPKCGYPNRSYEAKCSQCESQIIPDEEAKLRKDNWERLSPELKKEFEDNFLKEQGKYFSYLEYLKRRLVLDVIFGIIFMLIMARLIYYPSEDLLMDVILHCSAVIFGAHAGYRLNRKSGGAYTGMFLIGRAFFILFIFQMARFMLNPVVMWYGSFGMFLCLPVGYLWGMHIGAQYADRGI